MKTSSVRNWVLQHKGSMMLWIRNQGFLDEVSKLSKSSWGRHTKDGRWRARDKASSF